MFGKKYGFLLIQTNIVNFCMGLSYYTTLLEPEVSEDEGKSLESGTNSKRSADAWKIRQGSNVRKRISEIQED